MLRLAAEAGIARAVRFVVARDADTRRGVFGTADVFVAGGDNQSVIEARAAGLPIVGLLDSATRDVVTPGTNGLLARDEEDLARQLSRVALEEPMRRFMAARSRADHAGIDWSGVLRLHRTLYSVAAARADRVRPDAHT